MPHALMIGGTGFISTYCVEELARHGFTVTTITRGRTTDAHGSNVKTRLTVNCKDRPKFVSLLKDSLNLVAKDQSLSTVPQRWDIVIDCICYDPDHAHDVVQGLASKVDVFVQISTDSIYEVCEAAPKSVLRNGGTTEEYTALLRKTDKELRKMDEYGYEKVRR